MEYKTSFLSLKFENLELNKVYQSETMDTYSQQKSHAGSNLLKYVQVKLETRNILNFLFNNNNNNVNMKKFNSMTFHEIIKNALHHKN